MVRTMKDLSDRTISIVLPTYNERENVTLICERIRLSLEEFWPFEIIVVDDNSPDGTASYVQSIAMENSNVRLIQRPQKLGLGSAIRDGFKLAKGNILVMMDADLSHGPEYLPQLIHSLSKADIAVGSRYVPGGGTVGWTLRRVIASKVANLFGRMVVGIPCRDVTSGFAAFNKSAVESFVQALDPKGFKVLIEILANTRGQTIDEVPYTFVNRHYGKSKFSIGEILTYVGLCWRLRRKPPSIIKKSSSDKRQPSSG